MIKNMHIQYVKSTVTIEDLVNDKIGGGGIRYVTNDENQYIGVIGKAEYLRSRQQGRIFINQDAKYVFHDDDEYKIVKEILNIYPYISRVPVLDANRKILYEYIRDVNEETVESLRDNGVKVGEGVWIYDSYIDMTWGEYISIGNRVTISHATILAHDASMNHGTGKRKVGKVVIKDDVFIGYNSIILPGVVIGSKVVVGAGTVVAKDVPDNSVCCGNPMHIVETWDNYMDKHRMLMEQSPVYKIPEGRTSLSTDLKKRMLCEMNSRIGYVY